METDYVRHQADFITRRHNECLHIVKDPKIEYFQIVEDYRMKKKYQ